MKGDIVDMKAAAPAQKGARSLADQPDEKAAQAWRREMERAQMEAWLTHAVVGSSGAAQPVTAMPKAVVATATVVAQARAPEGIAAPAATVAHPHDAGSDPTRPAAVPRSGDRGLGLEPRSSDGSSAVSRPSPPTSLKDGESMTPQAVEHGPVPGRARRAPGHPTPPPVRPDGERPPELQTAKVASFFRSLGAIEVSTSVEGQATGAAESAGALAGSPPESSQLLAYLVPGQPLQGAGLPGGGAGAVPQGATPVAAAPLGEPAAPLAPMQASPAGFRQRMPGPAGAPVEADATVHQVSFPTLAAAREPIRLHADWSADGLRLWLGMDDSSEAALQAITARLQKWLSAEGVRLVSISCNGRVIVDSSDGTTADAFESDIEAAESAAASRPARILPKETP